MPAADFCRTIRVDCSSLSPDSGTCSRPPEVSSTAFNAQPPDLQPVLLMDMDFAINSPLVRRRMPRIWFLFIGSHLCSTLLSDHALQRRPCASLSLLLHQDVKRTSTSKLSNMLGTLQKGRDRSRPCECSSGSFIAPATRSPRCRWLPRAESRRRRRRGRLPPDAAAALPALTARLRECSSSRCG